jgi:hypothetical protein
MKRELFIGSSLEGLPIAEKLKVKIESECGDWISPENWKEGTVFTLNKNTLDCLVKASRKFEYGILVATKDDIIESRNQVKSLPRDNVMFEMGMFLGSLGLTRAFLLAEEDCKLPTDYNGVIVKYFRKDSAGSLERAVDEIITAFKTTMLSYNLKHVPSVALALGYFDNFIEPLAKKRQEQNINFKLEILLPKIINDINAERNAYKNSNESKEISIYGKGSRPVVYALKNKKNHFWDVPTTLSTLGKLMDKLLPTNEIGINQEKIDWVDHELRNFKGTLEYLIQQSAACKDKVTVTFIPY